MRRSGDPERTRAARQANAVPVPGPGFAYFFDLDGTLVDIADSPAGVRLDHEIRPLIEGLHRSVGGALALITGRSIADIDRLFPGNRLPVAGQHGVERRDGSGRMSRHPFPSARLDEVRRNLVDAIAQHPGLLLEDKGLSLALHYRRVPQLGSLAHRLMQAFGTTLGDQYCVQTGKRVVEVKPAGRDKGAAVMEFMDEEPFRGRTPLFIGDDVTDEYGFDMVNRLGGHSIKVGPGATAARWRLPNVRAVITWLSRGSPSPRPVISKTGVAAG